MSDSLFAHTLKEKRKSAGLSQAALASSLGVTRATVVNWEAGRGLPDLVLVPPLCRLLSLRPEALLGMSDPSDDQSEAEQLLLSQFRRLSPAGRRIVEKTAEAVLTEELRAADAASLRDRFRLLFRSPVAYAAGSGFESDEMAPSFAFVRRSERNRRADGLARVSGDSMLPLLSDGDLVYYESASAADPGEIVLALTNDGQIIKQLGPDRRLHSLNAALPYADRGEDDLVRVVGRVLGKVESDDFASEDELPALEDLFQSEIADFRRRYDSE